MKPIIIIGSGHAGITLAREIRAKDKISPLLIVTRVNGDLYYKPNLSKALSMGKSADALIMKTREVLQVDLDLNIKSETDVISIDVSEQEITLVKDSEIERIAYRSLVFATGASPLDLGLETSAMNSVISINSLEDYLLFTSKLRKESRILIIGAGYVGCEFASDLSSTGHKVDIVDLSRWPLERVIPRALGAQLVEAFPSELVNWHFGCGVESVQDTADGIRAQLSNGKSIDVDLVISAVGLSPNKQLAEQAGIKVHKGIAVDQYLRTSAEQVYALGDCAEYDGSVLPFIAPASAAASALAQTLTGNEKPLVLPRQGVAVKLAYCPLVICPPMNFVGSDMKGSWQVNGSGSDLTAVYVDQNGEVFGFALLGKAVSHKTTLLKQLNEALIAVPSEPMAVSATAELQT